MIKDCRTLEELWDYVHKINNEYFPENDLMPILGNGKTNNPKIMFVFINPTSKNISSDKKWQGERFPFVGTKQIWRIFHNAGIFDDKLINKINDSDYWSLEFTNDILSFLKRNSFYFTNIVKQTGRDATLPDSEKVKLFLPILEKEIEIIQPEYIVTFGLIPFENLTKQKIKLNDYYTKAIENKKLDFYDVKFGNFETRVIPCYFPVGRGEPKKAAEILKLVKEL